MGPFSVSEMVDRKHRWLDTAVAGDGALSTTLADNCPRSQLMCRRRGARIGACTGAKVLAYEALCNERARLWSSESAGATHPSLQSTGWGLFALPT